MKYALQFGDLLPYWDVLLWGLIFTIVLTLVSTVVGIALGTVCASARSFGPPWADALVGAYVELIRNTPFIVQLFFVFFGLPAAGVKLLMRNSASRNIVAISALLWRFCRSLLA
jgi:polar amino acid transport system permease protein